MMLIGGEFDYKGQLDRLEWKSDLITDFWMSARLVEVIWAFTLH